MTTYEKKKLKHAACQISMQLDPVLFVCEIKPFFY